MSAVLLDAADSAPLGTAASPAWRDRLALLLESTGDGIFGVDMAGRCMFANRAAAELLGYQPQALLGRNMHALIHHSREDGSPYPEADCPIFNAFRQGLACRIDSEVLWRADGSSFWAEYSSHPVVEAGQVQGAVVTVKDISERKRAESMVLRAKQQLEQRVAERTRELSAALEQLRELAAHHETVRESERTRIAREIHDELGSLLVALRMDVGWLGKRLAERSELQCKCQGMGRLIDVAVDNVGRIITDLRPSILDHQGLWAALEWQAQEFVEGAGQGLRVDLGIHVAHGVRAPEGGLAIAVFRILQEMLSNVARHAHARRVEIRISVDDPPAPVLYVEVCDDGVGAAPARLNAPSSHGVLGMRERAAHFGGRLSIDSMPGAGTRVRLVMPVPEAPS